MHPIEHDVFSHIHSTKLVHPRRGFAKPKSVRYQDAEWCSVAKVRQSFGYDVSSFRELVTLVAAIGYRNRAFNLLFRGQGTDYKDKNERTKILPAIFRPKAGQVSLRGPTLAGRVAELNKAVEVLRENRHKLDLAGLGLFQHREYQIALLQHYLLRKTPLLDATHSLRVATSFAMPTGRADGVLYVFGMPHPQGSISHFIDADVSLVKLQNVCPPNALRPHFQEGYLIGRLSFQGEKLAGDNAAYRLIAKYHLDNSSGNFWDPDFQPIPQGALLPAVDPFGQTLLSIVGPDPVL